MNPAELRVVSLVSLPDRQQTFAMSCVDTLQVNTVSAPFSVKELQHEPPPSARGCLGRNMRRRLVLLAVPANRRRRQ
jgi:hypothetical protein